MPPHLLTIAAIIAVQLGAALARGLFHTIGPGGTVFLRTAFAAAVLLGISRPRVRGAAHGHYRIILVFGAVMACMNFSYYSSIARLPIGVAVTIEFLGPLAVAVFGSRRRVDAGWGVLAGIGILLLSPIQGAALDPIGIGFALAAGACWGAYILLSARVGRAVSGRTGLALGLGVSSLVLLPAGVHAGSALLDPHVLLAAAGIAMLSTAIPFTLEMEALRRMPPHLFGVLMSLEPVIGGIIGFVVLHQLLGPREIAAMVLVTTAAMGSSYSNRGGAHS